MLCGYPAVHQAEAVGEVNYRVSGIVEDTELVNGKEIEAAASNHVRESRLRRRVRGSPNYRDYLSAGRSSRTPHSFHEPS